MIEKRQKRREEKMKHEISQLRAQNQKLHDNSMSLETRLKESLGIIKQCESQSRVFERSGTDLLDLSNPKIKNLGGAQKVDLSAPKLDRTDSDEVRVADRLRDYHNKLSSDDLSFQKGSYNLMNGAGLRTGDGPIYSNLGGQAQEKDHQRHRGLGRLEFSDETPSSIHPSNKKNSKRIPPKKEKVRKKRPLSRIRSSNIEQQQLGRRGDLESEFVNSNRAVEMKLNRRKCPTEKNALDTPVEYSDLFTTFDNNNNQRQVFKAAGMGEGRADKAKSFARLQEGGNQLGGQFEPDRGDFNLETSYGIKNGYSRSKGDQRRVDLGLSESNQQEKELSSFEKYKALKGLQRSEYLVDEKETSREIAQKPPAAVATPRRRSRTFLQKRGKNQFFEHFETFEVNLSRRRVR